MKYSFSSAFRDALIASVMTAIIVAPVFSLHLERAGMRTNIVPDWRWTIWACIAVFVVQMLKPLLAEHTRESMERTLARIEELLRN